MDEAAFPWYASPLASHASCQIGLNRTWPGCSAASWRYDSDNGILRRQTRVVRLPRAEESMLAWLLCQANIPREAPDSWLILPGGHKVTKSGWREISQMANATMGFVIFAIYLDK
ncbi:MAG: hypothetical protein WBX11_18445 [Thiobacillaceae bacterium]